MPLQDPIFSGRNALGAAESQSGGSALATLPPTAFPSLAGWWRLGQGITIVTGVSAWADQSGNGRTLAQATAGAQPLLQTDGSMLFDGVDDFLATGAFTLNQPCTYYMLLKQVSWTDTEILMDGLAATCAIAQATTTPQIALNAGSLVGNNANLTVGTYMAVAAVFNGAGSSLMVNGTTPTTGNAGAGNPGGIFVGATRTPLLFGNIQVKEVAAFSVAHDFNTQARIITYLRSL